MKRISSLLIKVGAPTPSHRHLDWRSQSFGEVEAASKACGSKTLSAPLVEVPASLGSQAITLEASGTVRPAQLLTVQPQVSGAIIDHHPNLVRGGLIAEGEVLLTIDARDYGLRLSVNKLRSPVHA